MMNVKCDYIYNKVDFSLNMCVCSYETLKERCLRGNRWSIYWNLIQMILWIFMRNKTIILLLLDTITQKFEYVKIQCLSTISAATFYPFRSVVPPPLLIILYYDGEDTFTLAMSPLSLSFSLSLSLYICSCNIQFYVDVSCTLHHRVSLDWVPSTTRWLEQPDVVVRSSAL